MATLECPHCRQAAGLKVLESRSKSARVRRRRQCLNCGERITTFEELSVTPQPVSSLLKQNTELVNRAQRLMRQLAVIVAELEKLNDGGVQLQEGFCTEGGEWGEDADDSRDAETPRSSGRAYANVYGNAIERVQEAYL